MVCCIVFCAPARETRGEDDRSPTGSVLEATTFPETDERDEDIIRYADGELTADVADVSLRRLLIEVARQSGATVQFHGDDLTVTDNFKRLPLDEAMRRLVKGRNFSLMYGKALAPDGTVVGTRLKEINLYGAGNTARVRRAVRKVVAPVRPKPVRPPAEAKRQAAQPGPRVTNTAIAPHPGEEEEKAKTEEDEQALPPFANPVTAAFLGGAADPDPMDDFVEDQVAGPTPSYGGDEDFPSDDQEVIYDDVTDDVYDDEPE